MAKNPTIGLVVPSAEDKVPAEGLVMYPDVTFVPRGVGVRALTPEGYDPAMAAILPAAEHLAKKGVNAIIRQDAGRIGRNCLMRKSGRPGLRRCIELGDSEHMS